MAQLALWGRGGGPHPQWIVVSSESAVLATAVVGGENDLKQSPVSPRVPSACHRTSSQDCKTNQSVVEQVFRFQSVHNGPDVTVKEEGHPFVDLTELEVVGFKRLVILEVVVRYLSRDRFSDAADQKGASTLMILDLECGTLQNNSAVISRQCLLGKRHPRHAPCHAW